MALFITIRDRFMKYFAFDANILISNKGLLYY